MVVIRQHGNDGELFDMVDFLIDIDKFVRPDSWHITIEECVGDRAFEIEMLASAGFFMSDDDFRFLYSGIHQTIDGHFAGFVGDEVLFEFAAVDSSFWEISGSSEFEAHMVKTYGAWEMPDK